MRDDNTRNTIIFGVCAVIILLVYQFVVIEPQAKRQRAMAAQRPAAVAMAGGAPGSSGGAPVISRPTAVAATPRVPIVTPALKGSLSLRGGRIDDLYLVNYRQTLAKDSPPVELLRPEGANHAWFADLGWTGANVPNLPTWPAYSDRRDTMLLNRECRVEQDPDRGPRLAMGRLLNIAEG